jgi:hypothetical protein
MSAYQKNIEHQLRTITPNLETPFGHLLTWLKKRYERGEVGYIEVNNYLIWANTLGTNPDSWDAVMNLTTSQKTRKKLAKRRAQEED